MSPKSSDRRGGMRREGALAELRRLAGAVDAEVDREAAPVRARATADRGGDASRVRQVWNALTDVPPHLRPSGKLEQRVLSEIRRRARMEAQAPLQVRLAGAVTLVLGTGLGLWVGTMTPRPVPLANGQQISTSAGESTIESSGEAAEESVPDSVPFRDDGDGEGGGVDSWQYSPPVTLAEAYFGTLTDLGDDDAPAEPADEFDG